MAVLTGSLLLLLMAGVLFSGYAISHNSWPWLGMISREIQATCQYSGTQWMVVVCLLSYFVTFLILERRLPQRRTEGARDEHLKPSGAATHTSPRPSPLPAEAEREKPFARLVPFRGQVANPDFWLVGFVVLVLLRYAVDYADAARSLQVVVMLAGIVIGKGVALWVGAARSFTFHVSRFTLRSEANRARAILGILTLLLAAASLWQPEMGMEFHYRGVRRWEGVWDNPNTYGLLMGVGLVLALGLLVASSGFQVPSKRSGLVSRAIRHLPRLGLLVAAALCGFGLLKSYSRGAWLATAIALVLLLVQVVKFQVSSGMAGRMAAMLRRNWFPSSILLLAIFVICFWQFRHTESPLLRRVFSVGNVNDFSWRNRVTAWQGAGRMMLDKPSAGFGWGKAEEVYRKDYCAARLEETAAIQLNDYLMLATSTGVPALICLVIYFALAMRVGTREFRHLTPALPMHPENIQHPTPNIQLSTAAAAGATVLLIGFWFDGGLFKLPTCVVFWVLLELAQCSSRGNEAQSNRDKKGESSLDGLSGSTALRWLAGVVAAFAIALTMLHLGLPQCTVSKRTLAAARNWLVPVREKADFDFLAANEIWSGKPLKALLQQAHLANYNRELVNWKIEDSLYQQFMLSSEIDPVFDGDMNWRRPLWEFFYPRIRKETSLTAATEAVMRHLRERVKLVPIDASPKAIAEMWRQERADGQGLDAVCVAALRSVGIPARLSASGQAEYWDAGEWKLTSKNPAP